MEDAVDVDPILLANEAFAPRPDCLFVIDVDPATGIDRIRKRGDLPNSFESEGQLVHARRVFQSIQQAYACHLDGSVTVSEIHRQICRRAMIASVNKISQAHGMTLEGLNATLRLFGGEEIEAKAG